jgi:uncharacterized protein YegL
MLSKGRKVEMPARKHKTPKDRWNALEFESDGTEPEVVTPSPPTDLTEIVCILDRSGSMRAIEEDARGGFNKLLEDQQNLEGNAIMTIVLFDDKYDMLHDGVDIQEVEPLTNKTYVPRGSTALYDAIGRTVKTVKDRIQRASDTIVPTKVLIVILTDGHENASHEFTRDEIVKAIDNQKAKGWEFIFLGADPEGFDQEIVASIGAGNVLQYAPTGVGMQTAYSGVMRAAVNYRSSGNVGDWTNQIRTSTPITSPPITTGWPPSSATGTIYGRTVPKKNRSKKRNVGGYYNIRSN